jgi:hypothetical protein
VGDAVFADPNVIQAAGKDAEGFYSFFIFATQYLGDRTGAMGDFRDRVDKTNPPAGTPNQSTIMAYCDTYVFAEALRRAGAVPTRQSLIAAIESIQNFVPGKDSYWTGAAPICVPRSFKAGDHHGNRAYPPYVVKDGQLKIVQTP